MIFKLVTNEGESPTTLETADNILSCSAFRAVNTSSKPAVVSIVDQEGLSKSITLMGGESIVLKKTTAEKVYSSSSVIRISGVSIY